MAFVDYAFSNMSQAPLLADISNSATTAVLTASRGDLFPTTFPFRVKIEEFDVNNICIKREFAECTARSGDALTITRGVEPCPQSDAAYTQTSVPLAFNSGSIVSLVVSKAQMDNVHDELQRLETAKLNTSTYNTDRAAAMDVFGATSTGNDNYSITSSIVTAYNNGQVYKIQADVANTGAATLKLNALAAKSIKKLGSGAFIDLETGDIIASQIFYATYNATLDIFQFAVDPATAVVPLIASTQSVYVAGENLTAGDPTYIAADGKAYKTDSSNSMKITVAGFANETVLTNASVKINSSGTDTHQTSLVIGTPYFLGKKVTGVSNSSTVQYVGENNQKTLGDLVANTRIGQTFTLSTDRILRSFSLKLRKWGTPTDNVVVKLYDYTSGNLLYTSSTTLSGSTVTTTLTAYSFTFPDVILKASTQYFVEVSRSGSVDAANYYAFSFTDTGTPYIGGSAWTYSGSAWTQNTTQSLYFSAQMGAGTFSESIVSDINGLTYVVYVGHAVSATAIRLAANLVLGGEISKAATAGSITLPLAQGYVKANINGTLVKIPFFNL